MGHLNLCVWEVADMEPVPIWNLIVLWCMCSMRGFGEASLAWHEEVCWFLSAVRFGSSALPSGYRHGEASSIPRSGAFQRRCAYLS